MIDYLSLLDTSEDKDKFRKLYELYHQKLYYTAYNIVKENHSAEDLVHDTFLKVIDHLDKIDDVSSHKTYNYVITILRNHCFNFLKHEQYTISCDVQETDIWISGDNPEDVIINNELVNALCVLLNHLKFPYRDVLILQYYNGMTSKEIGELLDLKPANVRQISKRAKVQLKEKLMETGGQTDEF